MAPSNVNYSFGRNRSMFNPAKTNKDKAAKAAKKKALDDVRAWSLNLIPLDLQAGLIIDVNEVRICTCNNPVT